ncbi:MAG: acetate uptake transporter [Deltaproteobacteria bacterium]|nr:acetate uptake transporter [Candidatus Anaeroferrophillacea bacterium]
MSTSNLAQAINNHEVIALNSRAGSISISDSTANPAPLGLLGFGMTTILLNLHNAGFFALDTMILAMGIFYGGVAQIIAGMQEWKKNNTFGATAFTSYGLFWMTLVALLVLPKVGLGSAPSDTAMVAYLTMWGAFSACMFIGTLKLTRILQVIFGFLTALFFLLAFADALASPTLKLIAGWEGILTGGLAFYAAIGQILNEVYGREIFPL